MRLPKNCRCRSDDTPSSGRAEPAKGFYSEKKGSSGECVRRCKMALGWDLCEVDFEGMAPVSKANENGGLWQSHCQRPDAPLAHRRPRYPLSSCFPAEPDSVSPGGLNRPTAQRHDQNLWTPEPCLQNPRTALGLCWRTHSPDEPKKRIGPTVCAPALLP